MARRCSPRLDDEFLSISLGSSEGCILGRAPKPRRERRLHEEFPEHRPRKTCLLLLSFSASSSGAATQRAAPRRRQMTSLVRRQPCALLAGQVDLSRLAFGGSGGLPRPGGPGPSPAAGGTPASGALTLKPRPVPPGTFIPSRLLPAIRGSQHRGAADPTDQAAGPSDRRDEWQ